MNLEFNPDIAKSLSFAASIEGVSRVGLKTRFILEYNGIEYGFQGKIEEGNFKFEIPKLNEVLKNITGTRISVPVKIEVISEGSIFSPWNETATLVIPQVVRATLESKTEAKVSIPKVNVQIEEKAYKETDVKKVEKKKKSTDKSEVFSSKINDFLKRIS